MLHEGVPINTIQAIIGRASVKTTLLYLGVPSIDVAKGIERIPLSKFLPESKSDSNDIS